MKETKHTYNLKSRFSASRLKDIVAGLNEDRRNLIINRGWGVLLDISSFSVPRGLLQWMIGLIDAELGEFRNPRNKTSIMFNKEMVIKVLGLPRGIRSVLLIGKHEESPYREFYKIDKDYGRRAPIAHAEQLVENNGLDEETWFRSFFLLVVSTYFCPGTGDMLSLEYLGSLGDSNMVQDYDWGQHIFRHTMSEIKAFQDRKKKALDDGNTNFQSWCGGCIPWVAVVYMDHLAFPVTSLSQHRIDYSLRRASHVTDADFKFVMNHDKNKLTLNSHAYGARPFRPFRETPYANGIATAGNLAIQEHVPPIPKAATSVPPGQTSSQLPPDIPNPLPQELPDFLKPIFEKHTSLWLKEVQKHTARLTKMHSKHMTAFASDVFEAMKTRQATLPDRLSIPTIASPPVGSPPIAATTTVTPHAVVPPSTNQKDKHIADDPCSMEAPGTQFWDEAMRVAAEVEKNSARRQSRKEPSSSNQQVVDAESEDATTRQPRIGVDIECPSFDLLEGQTWTQHIAEFNNTSPLGNATDVAPPNIVESHSGMKPPNQTTVEVEADVMIAPNPQADQPDSPGVTMMGTQTQEKKNRKKRAFLGKDTGAKQKRVKITDEAKDLYTTYILRRCIRYSVGDEEGPPFIDYGNYHVTYPCFRESLKPRGRVANNTMEIFIRHFNMVVSIPISSESLCTKFAFSQSITSKLLVHEDAFDPKSCMKEFQKMYKENKLVSNDLLYFAIVDGDHWILVCFSLLHKHFSVLDSMRSDKKKSIYDKAHSLVNFFATLAKFAKAFPKEDFSKYVQHNPEELRQQTTNFDCGIFVMLFMKHWDGKKMQDFNQDMFDNRMVVAHMLMISSLNVADSSWVLDDK